MIKINNNTFVNEAAAPKYLLERVANIVGIVEIIPAEIIIDEPFPIPWRVIKSANHIVNAEPAVITIAI